MSPLGERVYTKEHFSNKMPFPFPLPQNQIKIYESHHFTWKAFMDKDGPW